MNSQILNRKNASLAAVSALAVILWQAGLYFGAMILLLVTAGIAMARPCIRNERLALDGTPVLLMFAVMFVAASGMVFAVDQVSALFESGADTECTAETLRTARQVSIPEFNL